jgi:hypothetical protein
VNDKTEKDVEGSGRGLIEGTTSAFVWRDRIAGVPLVITTWHLQNASLERYRYTNLLKLHIFSTYSPVET